MSEEITPTEVALIELANEEHVKLVRCQAEKASLIFEIERLKAEREEIWGSTTHIENERRNQMPKSKVEPCDGWMEFENGKPMFLGYWSDREDYAREYAEQHKIEVRPVCVVEPEEKSRIMPQALLDWVEREREILKLGGQKYLDELNKIWPEPEEP